MSNNTRRSERRPMFLVCRYSIAGREYVDLSTNISSRGIFIKAFAPPPVGSEVQLTVKLPEEWGNQPLNIVGRVVHVNNDEDPHKRGMGIEFVSIICDSLPMIEFFVRQIYSEDRLSPKRLANLSSGPGQASFEYQVEDEKKLPF